MSMSLIIFNIIRVIMFINILLTITINIVNSIFHIIATIIIIVIIKSIRCIIIDSMIISIRSNILESITNDIRISLFNSILNNLSSFTAMLIMSSRRDGPFSRGQKKQMTHLSLFFFVSVMITVLVSHATKNH